MIKVNIGVGKTAIPGWVNIDNSFSVLIARSSFATFLARSSRLLSSAQLEYVGYAKTHSIIWADAAKRIPVDDDSVDIVYSCHMVEHLAPNQVMSFFSEVRRVLAPNGVFRLVFPDLKKLADAYLESGDADAFVRGTLLVKTRPQSLRDRIKTTILGERHHLWMYDGPSMVKRLGECGFDASTILPPGQTQMPEGHGLDLFERANDSVFIESVNSD